MGNQVYLKSNKELDIMRQAGQIVAEALEIAKEYAKPGVSTAEIDEKVKAHILKCKATPSFLGYGDPPFSGSICASLNEVVVHGIPSKKVILTEGDILSVDVGAYYQGFHGDAARTFCIGEVKPEVKQLVEVTEASFWKGYEKFVLDGRLGDVQHAIEKHALAHGYGIVRDFTGHGLGRSLHEAPSVPNYGVAGRGMKIVKGLVIAVEPMLNLGTEEVYIGADDWSVLTADHLPSAHYENTMAMTENGPELFTILK